MMIILTLMLLISTGVGAIRDKIRKIRRKQEEQIMNARKRMWVKLGPIIIRIAINQYPYQPRSQSRFGVTIPRS